LSVDAYSGVEVCTPIFLSEECGWQIILNFFQNSNGHIP
jgi:hypothetical protein